MTQTAMLTKPLDVRLYTRGDDAGSSRSANRAIRRTVEAGIIRNVSLMAPTHCIDDAATVLKDVKGCAFGMHFTLTCEYANVRWKPLLPARQIPTLVLADGTLPEHGMIMHEKKADPQQAIAEAAAQLDRLRKLGFRISYVDVHMCFDWLPGFTEALTAFCEKEGLVYLVREIKDLPNVPDLPPGASADNLKKRLTAAGKGSYLCVFHPTLDDEEMRQFAFLAKPTEFTIGRDRFIDTSIATDQAFATWCADSGVKPTAVGA
jgi:predicted glycoside hydrolase/deacetylase ChbG (UPF0249 family)